MAEEIIDILNIQPNKVNASLSGKYILLYGAPKVGKTVFCATQLPKPLILATEIGYKAIPGVMPQKITRWGHFKQVLKQLDSPEAHNKYETIVVDTIDILCSLCEEFICQQNGVKSIADIPYGKGYAEYSKELSTSLRKITMMGYGVAFIAHQEIKIIKDDQGQEIEKLQPVIDRRALKIVNALVDFILYVSQEWDSEGNDKRYFYTRNTKFILAGSRFGSMAPKIPFSYEALIDEIQKAMESSVKGKENFLINEKVEYESEVKRSFAETMAEAGSLWGQFPKTQEWNERKMKVVEEYFGQPIKLSTATAEQQDLVESVIEELKNLLPQAK